MLVLDGGEDEFLENMRLLGLSENEAKVYFIIFQLKSAVVRDIYSFSGVPRNKIYAVLSSLEEKGFVVNNGGKPVNYSASPVKDVFDRLRAASINTYNAVEMYLNNFGQHTRLQNPMSLKSYELSSEWVVETHLRNICIKAKEELVIFVNDISYFKEHFSDKQLKQLSRRLLLRILVADPAFAEQISQPCYLLSEEIVRQIGTVDEMVLQLHNENRIICLSDRSELLSVNLTGEGISGTVIYFREQTMFSLVYAALITNLTEVSR